MTEPTIPGAGDRLIFKRADGRYNVFNIGASDKSELARGGLSLDDADPVAHGHLEGGRVLHADHSKPDSIELFKPKSN
jgi:hypothetical protein